jgi:hypothetical protein
MSTDFQNKIDIEPILSQVNNVVRKGLNKVLYNYTVQRLSTELDNCRKEMERYKKELEEARKYYQQSSAEVSEDEDEDEEEEHILLNIEDISDNGSEISIEQILSDVKVNSQIKTMIVEEEAEEENTSEAEEEEEEEEAEEEEETKKEEEDDNSGTETEASEEEEEEEEDDDEEEVFEIEIDDVTYFATSEENGPLYDVDEYGEPGNKVGYLKDGEPVFLV